MIDLFAPSKAAATAAETEAGGKVRPARRAVGTRVAGMNFLRLPRGTGRGMSRGDFPRHMCGRVCVRNVSFCIHIGYY